MEPIVSGTTTEKIVRAALLAALVSAFAIAFLWDGYVDYARENVRELARSLGLDPDQSISINDRLTASEAQRLIQEVGRGVAYVTAEDVLGRPSLDAQDQVYYVGPGGHIRLHIDRGRVSDIEWITGVHSETDQMAQRWLGHLLGIIGLVLIFRVFRILTMRISLTDAGLKVRGRPVIPFASMTALRAEPSGKIGLIDLEYELDGRKEVLRLDDYAVKEYEAILAAICEHASLADPRPAGD
jgi:hypothetical protein